ncbi:MAG: alanine racemase [Epsilonproteobacteria bacterium]|nr:alanine racemase [Campylobacterota bacterium]
MAYIALSKANYFHNLTLLSQKVGGREKLSVVLKDNAYGHGLIIMAKLAAEFGIKRAVVRHVEEAEEISAYFEHILILAPRANIMTNPKYAYVINTLEAIAHFPKTCNVHLKIDTGMHRNGIEIDEMEEALLQISQNELSLDGVMTHFRAADELGSSFFWQYKQWQTLKQKIIEFTTKEGLKTPLFHSANSAALLRLHHFKDDFARCGIASYGYHDLPTTFSQTPLKPVLSLWAEKISSRILYQGQSVGYGGVYTAKEDTQITTYDIGYGDGFFRYDGSKKLTTADHNPFVGRLSMDSCVIASEANNICLFDDAAKMAKFFNTISYDVLTKLSTRILRVIKD